MKEKMTIQELIVRISERSGATKKLSTEMLKVLPEVIEAGLERDGEVRIAGLGTFKLVWVKARRARNLKTGASVEVPAHNKVVFYPEKGMKEKVNEDYKYLTYQVVGKEKKEAPKKKIIPEPVPPAPEETEKEDDTAVRTPFTATHTPPPSPQPASPDKEAAPARKRKMIYWVIPLMFVIVALLIVIFYMKNCQEEIRFPEQKETSPEQVIKPAQPPPVMEETVTPEETQEQAATSPAEETKPAPAEAATPPPSGFPSQTITTSQGQHLFQVAREIYGNPYLWALIYKENKDKIADPGQVVRGTELFIPGLEGTPGSLTRNDSSNVSLGYGMLYDYYTATGDERAKDFKVAQNRYRPK